MEVAELDAEEQGLRDLGIQADRMEDRPLPADVQREPKPADHAAGEAKPTETQPASTDGTEKPPVSSETEPTREQPPGQQRQRDDRGRFQPKPQAQQPQQPPGQQPTRDEKAAERQDRSWKALDAEKAEFRRQQAQWQEQTRIAQLQATRSAPEIQKDGLNAKGYYDGYQMFRKNAAAALQNGDPEQAAQNSFNALRSLETAYELRGQEQQRQAQRDQANVEYAWRSDMNAVAQDENLKDAFNPESPVYAIVDRLVKENPWIYYIPHGFRRAVEIAGMLTKMDSISELQDENERLRARLEELEGDNQPLNGGSPRRRGAPKSLDDMDEAEMDAHMEAVTRQADEEMRGGY